MTPASASNRYRSLYQRHLKCVSKSGSLFTSYCVTQASKLYLQTLRDDHADVRPGRCRTGGRRAHLLPRRETAGRLTLLCFESHCLPRRTSFQPVLPQRRQLRKLSKEQISELELRTPRGPQQSQPRQSGGL